MRTQKKVLRAKAVAIAVLISLCIPTVYTAQKKPIVAEAATPAPSGISIVAENGSATITWEPVSGAKTYALFLKDRAGNVTLVHNRINGTSYDLSGLRDNERYGFVLKAYTSEGWSGYSATNWVTCNLVTKAPENVTATPGDGEVTVSWAPSYAAQTYAVFLKDTSGNVTLVHNRVNGTSYTIKGLKNNVRMGFVVKAYVNRQWSTWSKVAWATPTEASKVPQNLQAETTYGKVLLSWDVVPQAEKYAVYQKNKSGVTTLLSSNVKGNSFEFTGLTENETFGFTVKAFVKGAWGRYSQIVWVTIPAPNTNTLYTTTGPDNTTVKITINGARQMVDQKIYDTKGNLQGVNTVKYSLNGRISRIDCTDAAGNSLGYIEFSYNAVDRSELVMCHALKGDLMAAITAEIDNDKNLGCFFVQAEAGEKKYYKFLFVEGERMYTAYSLWGTTEDGIEVERVYDTSGVYRLYVYYFYDESNRLIKEECFSATGIPSGYRIVEYLEDGYIKYTYYGSSGEIHSVTVCDKDGIMRNRSNYTGNVMMSVDTFEYYENGNLRQELSTHYNSNGSVSLKTESVYDERENQLRYTSYRADGSKYFEGTYEYYENKQLKGSVEIYYSSGGKKENEERYEYYADGNKKSFLVINYDSNGEISFKHEELYNENGDVLSATGWDENGYKLYEYLYEYRDNGTLKCFIQIFYNNGKEAGCSESLYNESEQKVSVVSYNVDGTRNGMSLYEYYDSGEEKSRKSYYYNDDGEVYSIWLYVYDKDGKLLNEITYTADEKKNYEHIYEYHENGEVRRYLSVGYDITDGSCTGKTETTYDKSGNELSRTFYNADGIRSSEHLYEYHGNGKVKYKLVNYYDETGELSYYWYARYDETGKSIESDTVYPDAE